MDNIGIQEEYNILEDKYLEIYPDFYHDELTDDEVLSGLVNHGLFFEKLPNCFTTENLSKFILDDMIRELNEQNTYDLKNNINKYKHDYIRYESIRDINIPRQFGIPHPESYIIHSLAIKTVGMK